MSQSSFEREREPADNFCVVKKGSRQKAQPPPQTGLFGAAGLSCGVLIVHPKLVHSLSLQTDAVVSAVSCAHMARVLGSLEEKLDMPGYLKSIGKANAIYHVSCCARENALEK